MKKHFITLFNYENRWRTISFFIASVLLIIASLLAGISDNPPGIALAYAGIIVLFLVFTHPWRKPANYAILAGICAGIIIIIFVGLEIWSAVYIEPRMPRTPTQGENVAEAIILILIFFICLPGVVVGLLGTLITAILKKPSVAE